MDDLADRLFGVLCRREALAAGVIDPEGSQRWQASLERAAETGGFYASTNAVMVTGIKA